MELQRNATMSLIIGGVVLLILVAVGTYFYSGSGDTVPADTTELDIGAEISGAAETPADKLPETNPFKAAETNPFKGYQNPF
ncbi:hypothetical protein A2853_04090 [Candidatus Kaiserbacteria bacterium RIFCSPHIGHO2_01_FULL_55_17]|uniref:Uncharacterized protein n=1 Tax=Candidatus Kaiserbacteria bacterium RIFCSPHIGHO2_01_FULL_55_17 TaxID=1798484 RepID=A0A1F6D8N6_9BACT|nr:MAG: hypothetical protein A2853_04090 [Candidatus Kaiserbacteria bacterium RIFCSPHIGHO2_01_FULL_55_17]